jgi:hypothetical protein
MVMYRARVFSLLALFLLTGAAVPMMFAQPQALPAKRIIANLEAAIEKKPKDHHLIYTLARVHYLSFVNRSSLIPGYGNEQSGQPAPRHTASGFLMMRRYEHASETVMKRMGIKRTARMDVVQRRKFGKAQEKEYAKLIKAKWTPKPLTRAELRDNGLAAMKLFDKAINLAPKQALYHLGRASLGEQMLQLVKEGKLDKPHPGVSKKSVADLYFKTFELALPKDLTNEYVPVAGLKDLVSHEAASAYLRLTKGKKKLSAKEKARVVTIREGIAKMKKLKRGPITPILIGDGSRSTLDQLLDPSSTVWFDLDGDGVKEHWPWVQADTGILVWAPLGAKTIESGRQLFGSVTFFLFHRDGYEALRLLDDDQDGELRDLELDGIAIWYDRDGNGRAGPEEVVRAWDAGVEAIATRSTGYDGRAPKNASGLRYSDGRVVPTIDWITERR